MLRIAEFVILQKDIDLLTGSIGQQIRSSKLISLALEFHVMSDVNKDLQ